MNRQQRLTLPVLTSMIWVMPPPLPATQIDDANQYAWSSNSGWINHRTDSGEVTVYDDHLEGYAWSENVGWIKLGSYSGGGTHTYANTSSSDWGVNQDASGNLSGYAWSSNAGWINFNPANGGVTIDRASGDFDGYAWGENIGWIHFNDAGAVSYKVAALPVDGACGASNGGSFTTQPADNLCTTGTASTVSGGGPWSWSCEGIYGGSDVQCAADIQTYTITASASPIAGGTASCEPNTVEYGGSSSCTASANLGYQFTTWSGHCTGVTCELSNVDGVRQVVAIFEGDPTFGFTCTPSPSSVTVTTPSHTGNDVVQAETAITTDGVVIVPDGVRVSYMAATSITLNENFHAENGSNFQAMITELGCSAN